MIYHLSIETLYVYDFFEFIDTDLGNWWRKKAIENDTLKLN